jgi:hypothetical protein
VDGKHYSQTDARDGAPQGSEIAVRVDTDPLRKYAALIAAPVIDPLRGSKRLRPLSLVAALGNSACLPELTSAWLIVLELTSADTTAAASTSSHSAVVSAS